jgi:hypothetical protein
MGYLQRNVHRLCRERRVSSASGRPDKQLAEQLTLVASLAHYGFFGFLAFCTPLAPGY